MLTRSAPPSIRWCVEIEVLRENPLRGFVMRIPKTLPSVPTEDELRAVLAACPETLEGTRDRTTGRSGPGCRASRRRLSRASSSWTGLNHTNE